jgi:hypothetical protein
VSANLLYWRIFVCFRSNLATADLATFSSQVDALSYTYSYFFQYLKTPFFAHCSQLRVPFVHKSGLISHSSSLRARVHINLRVAA